MGTLIYSQLRSTGGPGLEIGILRGRKSCETKPLTCGVYTNSGQLSVRIDLTCRTPIQYLESWRIGWCGKKNPTNIWCHVLGEKTVHKEERGVLHLILYTRKQQNLRRGAVPFLVVLDQTQLRFNISVYSALLPQEIYPHTSVFHPHRSPLRQALFLFPFPSQVT